MKSWTSHETTFEALQRQLLDHWIAILLALASIGAVVLLILVLTARPLKAPSATPAPDVQSSVAATLPPVDSQSEPQQTAAAQSEVESKTVSIGIRDITTEAAPAVKTSVETIKKQEKLVAQFISNFDSLVRILKGVTDEESARAALPKLQIARELMILQVKELRGISNNQQRASALNAKLPQLQAASKEIESEIERLKTLPAVYRLLEPQIPSEKNLPKLN